jgi:tryptophan-rich sensory protein
MACAAWLVWRRDGWPGARTALAWFGVQLALNVGWSGIFFALRSTGLALLEILILWLAIAATAVVFWGRSAAAALLLVPYLLWTSFAAVLNLAIWVMNS